MFGARTVGLFLILCSASQSRPADVVLAEQKRSVWAIHTISTNVAEVRFAAEELQKYLREINGAKLSIASTPGTGKTIAIGLRRDISSVLAQSLPAQRSGYDGY